MVFVVTVAMKTGPWGGGAPVRLHARHFRPSPFDLVVM